MHSKFAYIRTKRKLNKRILAAIKNKTGSRRQASTRARVNARTERRTTRKHRASGGPQIDGEGAGREDFTTVVWRMRRHHTRFSSDR